MTRDECILLGSISKTHGVRGELILRTGRISFEPEKNWGSLFLEIDGIMVPFFIAEIFHLRGNDWVIGFDDISDKSRAEVFTGKKVWVSRELVDPGQDDIYYDQLAGFSLHDRNSGKSGIIEEYLDIPGNPVFDVVIDGMNHLVPAQEEFILELDAGKKTILVNLPEGLL